MHYENVDLNQRKDDASDDSSVSSENEGIDISLPVKYPDLSAKHKWFVVFRGGITDRRVHFYLDIIIRIKFQYLMVPVCLEKLKAECKLLKQNASC